MHPQTTSAEKLLKRTFWNPKNLDFKLICEFAGTNADFIIRKLFVKIKARQKFFRTIREGSNFWEAQKKFEKDMKWNPNLPKRI